MDFTLEAFESDVHGLLASGAYGSGPNGPVPSDAPNLVRLLELTGRRLGPPQTRR
ncbi:MAG TPA: hypothetical protein VFC03_07935 [Acidimicrobiales bacterium]|nr:hypothetical protein [Acidimicrobiales bacterium]